MSRYSLNLPQRLKQEAEQWAAQQGVSLNQFILWAVAEKVGEFKLGLEDPAFPGVTYKRSASGQPIPVLRGIGIRVRTIVVADQDWKLTPAQIAAEYDISESQVNEALAFYERYQSMIDNALETEQALETAHG